MLSGEVPGIPNLPPLTDFIPTDVEEEVRIANEPFEVRSIVDLPKEQDMDLDAIKSELATLVSESVAEAVKGVASQFRTEMVKSDTETVEAVSSDVTSLMEEIRTLREAQSASAEERRLAEVKHEVEALVRVGRLTPAEAASEMRFLVKLSADDVKDRLGDLSRRSPIIASRLTDSLIPEGDEDVVRADMGMYTLPQSRCDAESLAIFKEAHKRAQGDEARFAEIVFALSGESNMEVI